MPPRKHYTPEQMGKAVEAVREGANVSKAAERFGVPRVTLQNKVKGISPLVCSMGPQTYLTKEDEYILEQWAIVMKEKHMPVTKEQFLDSVQKIIIEKGIKTPFVNNRPGNKWYKLFLQRHPIVSERTAQNLTTARNNVTEKAIENWFEEVGDYLEKKGLKSVLEEPERIFNADESAFYLSPKPGKVLAEKGDKHVYSSSGDEKDNLTVLISANAAGQLAPPMVVFDYERVPAPISRKFPDDFAIGRSQSGWMCGSTFYEYVANVFNPWLEKQNIKKPVLFFLDGHKSHLTLHLSNFCIENGIEIIALNPNSTHILQPMDLSVFRPLKSSWKKAVSDWRLENMGQNLKKENFAPLLKVALQNITADCLKNGFRAGGLHPFGPEYVDMTKIKSRKLSENVHEHDQSVQKQFLEKLDREVQCKLGSEKLVFFKELYYKSRGELNERLPVEDTSLYIIWASTKQSIEEYRDNEVTASISGVPNSNIDMPDESNSREVSASVSGVTNSNVDVPDESNSCEVSASLFGVPNFNVDVPDESNSREASASISSVTNINVDVPGESNSQACNFHLIDHNYPKTPDKMEHSTMQETKSPSILDTDMSTRNQEVPLPSASTSVYKTPSNNDNCNMPRIEYLSTSSLRAQKSTEPETHKTPVKIGKRAVAPSPFIGLQKTPERPNDSLLQRSEHPIITASLLAQDINKQQQTHKTSMKIGNYVIPSPFKRNLHWPDNDESTKGKKRKIKEKLPFAVTSQAWRDYHEKKELEKKQKLEEKEKRAKDRELNKLLKEKLNKEKQLKRGKGKNLKGKVKKLQDSSTDNTDTEVKYCESDDSPYEVEEEEETIIVKDKKRKPEKRRKPKERPSESESDDEPLSTLSSKNLSKGNYVIVKYEGEFFPGVIEKVDEQSCKISTMTFSSGKTFKWPDKKDTIWYQKKDIMETIAPPVLTNKRGFFKVKEMDRYLPFTI